MTIMMYSSWDMKRDGQNFLSFWTVLCLFTPLTTQKNKILKNLKKAPWDIIILHMCTINDNQIMYGSWDIECDRHIFLLFWTIFCPFTPLTTQNIKILKNLKNAWGYYHFTQVYKKLGSYAVLFLRYGAWRM